MTTTNRTRILCALFALAVPVSLVRADTCTAPPLFDASGPSCATSRQGMQCVCSECLEWDAATGATWYQVRRCNAAGTSCTIVGDTRWKNNPGRIATRWCVAWDNPFPVAAAIYTYSIRSCTDGPTGPICAAALSNPVTYATAPYMCIAGGVEIACAGSATNTSELQGGGGDADGDGSVDLIDGDDDGDRIPDLRDNCLLTANPGQRDSDADGIGDACDLAPDSAGADDPDRDDDGIPDATDVCSSVYDPDQADADHDRSGDACDNCPEAWNPMQADFDANRRGDVCDTEDGTIFAVWTGKTRLSWDLEAAFTSWCVYRGDLNELRQSGAYSQLPGANALAARSCGLATAGTDDTLQAAPGSAAFFLVGGRPTAPGFELGDDGSGHARPNANPCP